MFLVRSLLKLHERTEDNVYLDAAVKAGKFRTGIPAPAPVHRAACCVSACGRREKYNAHGWG